MSDVVAVVVYKIDEASNFVAVIPYEIRKLMYGCLLCSV
jgi:hypothetical protein